MQWTGLAPIVQLTCKSRRVPPPGFELRAGAATLYSVEWKYDRWMIIWKGCGRKLSWPNYKVLPGLLLEGLRKTTKSQVSIAGLRNLSNTKQECYYDVGLYITFWDMI
jgi:hypothetical protein